MPMLAQLLTFHKVDWTQRNKSILIKLHTAVHGDTIDSRLLSVFLVTFTTAIVALKNHDSNR
jgi:hypothetical protein